jgi:hypothetical protein
MSVKRIPNGNPATTPNKAHIKESTMPTLHPVHTLRTNLESDRLRLAEKLAASGAL